MLKNKQSIILGEKCTQKLKRSIKPLLLSFNYEKLNLFFNFQEKYHRPLYLWIIRWKRLSTIAIVYIGFCYAMLLMFGCSCCSLGMFLWFVLIGHTFEWVSLQSQPMQIALELWSLCACGASASMCLCSKVAELWMNRNSIHALHKSPKQEGLMCFTSTAT
jgi:hypothetical protein